MRIDIPAALLAHLGGDEQSLAICWCIEKKNGEFIRGTDHDEDHTIPPTGDSPESDVPGFYPAGANITGSTVQRGSDMAADNMDVDGAIPTVVDYIDVTVADIEAGLLNQAPVIVSFVNWKDPSMGFAVYKRGFLGDITRDSDGKYTTEVRGMLQLLAQIFVETYGEKCVVKRFGDERCKLDLAPYTFTGTVTAVTNRRNFETDLSASPFPDFRGGPFTFLTGDNATYSREVKGIAGVVATFWDTFPNDVQVGDTFSVIQDCNRSKSACKLYGNVVNFRGYGVFIPGIDALSKGPT